jgi:CRP/FNR family transcriptional regulator/CRP/FNR family cyclic AMP-dependent transcriptional regulator
MKILPTVKLETLKSLSFFKQISDAEIIQMQQLMETRYYHKDEIVISEQEPGDLFFILLEGSVNINKKLDGGELEILTTLEKPGDFFGEMSLLEDKPRSASVVAAKDCTILIIRKEHFLILVKSNPELTMHIAASVANFLRDTDLKLITTLIKKNHEIESAYQKLKEA